MRAGLPYCIKEVSLWRIVIPSATKQFYIANGKVQNGVQVVPTAKLTFMGRVYNAGSKLAFQLRPYQVVQILSTGALKNTQVISQHRVFITIGYIYKYPGITLSCSNVACSAPQKCQMRAGLPYCIKEVSLWRIVIPSPTKQFYIA